MWHKSYIAVPFALGLVCVAVSTANAIKERKETELLGQDKFMLCDLLQNNCTNIKERQKMPIKITPPLGLSTALNKQEVYCLAKNISEEAVQNYLVDKIHVGWGTINRVKLNYARTICQVISQYNAKHKTYMMSWYGNLAKRNRPPTPENVRLAIKLLKGEVTNPSPDCMITNWFNIKRDSKSSFNANYMYKDGVCSHRPKWTPHFYMEVPIS